MNSILKWSWKSTKKEDKEDDKLSTTKPSSHDTNRRIPSDFPRLNPMASLDRHRREEYMFSKLSSPSSMHREIPIVDSKCSDVKPKTSNSAPLDNHKGKLPTFIGDNFNSVDEVIVALREAGLESSNLILGIDFTKSNEWMGKSSFKGKCLHAIGDEPNPYEQAISIIGRTLSPFDEDNLIPCFGFGDVTTRDNYVFSFYPDHRPCNGFEEALARYKEIVPHLNLSGPTSFAPIIDAAIHIVEESDRQYHVLVIIADGQVTTRSDSSPGKLSYQEQETIDAIVAASHCPLSIVLIGVGDGPWDAMHKFDDNIPQRAFDNFQFVNFTKIMSETMDMPKKEAAFALAALMEIPFQYRATQSIDFPKTKPSRRNNRKLPPPPGVISRDNSARSVASSSSSDSTVPVEQACPICLTNPKDMAFGCGHLVCKNCAPNLQRCHMCRRPITSRVRLYA